VGGVGDGRIGENGVGLEEGGFERSLEEEWKKLREIERWVEEGKRLGMRKELTGAGESRAA